MDIEWIYFPEKPLTSDQRRFIVAMFNSQEETSSGPIEYCPE